MRRVRPLTLTFLSFFLLPHAWAIDQIFSTSYSYTSGSGNTTPGALSGPGTLIRNSEEKIAYRVDGLTSPKLPGTAGVSSAIYFSQPDYSHYLVREQNGQDHGLMEKAPMELSGAGALSWGHGPSAATLGWNGSLTPSPFAYQSFNASYQHSFFEKSSLVGVNVTTLSQKQPRSFFIDRDFRNKQRPLRIHAQQIALQYEQVWTERFKSLAELSTAQRQEERPRNIGYSLTGAYAVTERISSRLKLRRFEELRQPLKNERGYFSMWEGEALVNYEPVYGWIVSGSYTLGIERELEPTTLREVQAAMDQYGLGLKYAYRDLEFLIQGALGLSNTGYRTHALSGGLTWKL